MQNLANIFIFFILTAKLFFKINIVLEFLIQINYDIFILKIYKIKCFLLNLCAKV